VAGPKEQILYESSFERPTKTSVVTVRITVPRQEGDSKWVCSFQLVGVGEDQPHRVTGSDSLQCVKIASEFIRRCLSPLNVLEVETKSPPEVIFPRHIPISYGLDFQKYLEAKLDLEVARKELSISESRGRRPK
jgi:hypothetical protein